MRRPSLWLLWGLVVVCALGASNEASAQGQPVKPYIVFIVDNSGSMDGSTDFGPPSCPGAGESRMDHAKCAVQNIANSYGDMQVALARFRMTSTDTDCSDGCTVSAVSCSACYGNVGDPDCTPALRSPDQFQLLTPLAEGAQSDLVNWTDFTCGQCTTTGVEPELFSATWTPLAGSLSGARRYWQGNDPDWTAGTGSDPVFEDPLNDVFTSPGVQCRPYITVLLTDGVETCAEFDAHTVPAAAALLSTPIDIGTPGVPDVRNYRIEMKPIGFGIAPGDAQIEAMAHAGGVTNDGNAATFEGSYAQNEEELQLAISEIIADAIQFEECNLADDDCDGNIDEDFPTLGDECVGGTDVGICQDTGHIQCTSLTGVGCVIDDLGDPPAPTETCNGLDDNCNGQIDEGGVCNGCSGVELCNGIDDDCDGVPDDGLVRTCGTNVGECTSGTETCAFTNDGNPNNNWAGCTAIGGTMETCDGDDDDCDGTVDGFVEACTVIPGNPGTGPWPCHPGTHVCPPTGTGVFESCIGEIGPETEICDTIDNNCNGVVDENTGGADCSSDCGLGETICVNGTLECDSVEQPTDDTCNNIDDNCNGQIDENAPPGGPCTNGGTICNGNSLCMGGMYVCVGEGIEPEICNCEDDNCNILVDDGMLCAVGSTCVDPAPAGFACQCARPCAGGEFPCSIGQVCIDGFCLVDPCVGVNCTPDVNGDVMECVGGACVRSCDALLAPCPAPLICFGPTGECEPDDCTTFPDRCTADQLCVGGTCISDPCNGVTCGSDEYCLSGDCYNSCAGVDCPDGDRCRLGLCEDNPCPDGCPGGQVCDEDDGECQANPCSNTPCPGGEWCNPQSGICEQDPCLGVTCPGTDQVCVAGSCFDAADLVDAGVDADTDPDLVTTGGGGGCQVGGGDAAGATLLLLGLALATRRRRAREVRS